MTAEELIAKLQTMPKDAKVYVDRGKGFLLDLEHVLHYTPEQSGFLKEDIIVLADYNLRRGK